LYIAGMKKLFFLIAITLFTAKLNAQGWLPMGAESAGLANATVAVANIWSVHHNPGALAFVKKSGVGASYQNRFLLRELQSQGITAALKLKKGVVSLGGQFFGYQNYRTTRIGGGYALKLAENFALGVQLNYVNLNLNNAYGSKSTLTAGLGLLANITENWRIGFAIFNLNRAKLVAFEDDRFTTLFRVGTAYKLSTK
jgi:hypothetical protein